MRKLLLCCVLALILSSTPLIALGNNDTVIIDESGGKTLEEGYGVYTSLRFYGLFSGWSGTTPLIIICGKDRDRIFHIHIEAPNKLEPGYAALPEECYSWIVISNDLVTASAGETIKVPVTITIPDDVVYINRHDQVAFFVKDITQTGFHQIAYQSSWFFTTDAYIPQLIPQTDVGGVNTTLILFIIAAASGGGCGVYLLMKRKRKHAKT